MNSLQSNYPREIKNNISAILESRGILSNYELIEKLYKLFPILVFKPNYCDRMFEEAVNIISKESESYGINS